MLPVAAGVGGAAHASEHEADFFSAAGQLVSTADAIGGLILKVELVEGVRENGRLRIVVVQVGRRFAGAGADVEVVGSHKPGAPAAATAEKVAPIAATGPAAAVAAAAITAALAAAGATFALAALASVVIARAGGVSAVCTVASWLHLRVAQRRGLAAGRLACCGSKSPARLVAGRTSFGPGPNWQQRQPAVRLLAQPAPRNDVSSLNPPSKTRSGR